MGRRMETGPRKHESTETSTKKTTHLVFFVFVFVFSCLRGLGLAENWPQWRGPSLNGLSAEKNLPSRWSTTDNVAWKLPLPAWSGSTPIVWGDRVFLNVADDLKVRDRDNLHLWCIDRTTGTPLWKKPLGGGNHQERKQNMSTPSPVTDGTLVW